MCRKRGTRLEKYGQSLRVFERKIHLNIFDRNIRRIIFKHELYELYMELNIVRVIKINGLRWLGHEQLMDKTHTPIKLFNPDERRRTGRPIWRCKDAVQSNLSSLGVSDWRSLAGSRYDLRSLLEELKIDRRLASHIR